MASNGHKHGIGLIDRQQSVFAKGFAVALALLGFASVVGDNLFADGRKGSLSWRHLSSADGHLPVPMPGRQQTAGMILDVDRDGVNGFVITERTATPSVVWFRRASAGWQRYVIDDTKLRIEAGGAFCDIDGDGDLDISFGGDSRSNQVWWWENPYPNYDPDTPWKRRLIKNSGPNKQHDQLFGDFDDDGQAELVFWNQNARSLCFAEIPDDPKRTEPWPFTAIYIWDSSAEGEHEGLAAADVDGDGKLDIVGAGNWYRHEDGTRFSAHVIDARQRFTRAAAGQLKKGGRPEVVFVPGDADGPLKWYEWNGDSWSEHTLIEKVIHGHSLELGDVDRDGNLDIFCAEMNLGENNPDARMRIFFGNGQGTFQESIVAKAFANHESRLGDLDGDGDLDILGKPYHWKTPRIDVWLNNSGQVSQH